MDFNAGRTVKSAQRKHAHLYDDVALWDRPLNGTNEREADREFWTKNDKAWAWYMFLIGADLESICEFVGGKKEELAAWIRKVCAGEAAVCTHPFPLLDHQPRKEWTDRHTKVLLRMRAANLDFKEACRLLERRPETVREQWRRIKNEGN